MQDITIWIAAHAHLRLLIDCLWRCKHVVQQLWSSSTVMQFVLICLAVLFYPRGWANNTVVLVAHTWSWPRTVTILHPLECGRCIKNNKSLETPAEPVLCLHVCLNPSLTAAGSDTIAVQWTLRESETDLLLPVVWPCHECTGPHFFVAH